MKSALTQLLLVLALGCGRGVSSHPGGPPDAAPLPADAPRDTDTVPALDARTPAPQPLGMNDVTMLFPFPFVSEDALVARMNDNNGADFVPRDLFARLVTAHGDIDYDYEDFQIFSLRFDLCDRVAPGPCPEAADGSLRLVFQPLVPHTDQPADAGLHAFYRIPAADLAAVIDDLRKIARTYNPDNTSAPLDRHQISVPNQLFPSLLARYAPADRLIRLSVMGQDSRTSDLRVVFRSVELRAGQLVDVTIPTLNATEQVVTLADVDPGYVVTPVANAPTGFTSSLSSGLFNSAAPEDQRSALDALVATQNPLLHTASTVQCVTCHVSTYLAVHRGQIAGIDVRSLPSRYTTRRDVRVSQGISASEERALHGFSWIRHDVAISQRVANETAQVLDELEQRFPVAH